MDVLVYGNGASLTGAPRSLLTLLQHRPQGVRVEAVLTGGGPLLADYQAVTDSLAVAPVPTSRGMSVRRLMEEALLAASLARRGRCDRLLVNTIDYEVPLACAVAARAKARVIIREQPFYLDGLRGRLRKGLLLALPREALRSVSPSHADAFSHRIGREVRSLSNVVVRAKPVGPRPPRPFTFLAVGSGRHKGIHRAVEAYEQMSRRADAALLLVSRSEVARLPEGASQVEVIDALGEQIEQHADAVLGVADGEPFGRLAVEAALAGLPTVAWDVAGYRDVVPSLFGTLVAPFDTAALARAMDALVGFDETAGVREQRRSVAADCFGLRAISDWWDWVMAPDGAESGDRP